MNSLPKDLDRGLLQELECPVCFECMVPPITMCENGHNICPKCKPKLNNCPSCNKPFLHVRNLALESLSRHAITEEGQLPSARFPRIVECPFARISKDFCSWNGPMTGIKDHVKFCHKSTNDTFEVRGVFTVVLTGLSPTQHYRKAVFIADDLFFVYWRIKDGSFYCTVFYVGEQEKCSNYTYRFVLTTESDDRKISMSFPTRSIMENLEELLQSGDCVVLNYNTVLKFINPNMNLECEFQINAIEVAEDISDKVSQPHSCAEPDVHSSHFGHSKWHRKFHKHENLHSPLSAFKHASVFKPGRCVHGRRFKHCKICRYSTVLTNTPGSNVASGTIPLQNSQQQTVLYCAPGVNLTEGASANNNFLPSAPAKTALHSDPKGSDSYWKCPICDQIAPNVPVSLPHPGWHVSSSVPDSKRCKMCGQITP